MARTRKSEGRGLTFLGILAGAALGAAVALVYTPARGEENRKRLNEWAGNRLEEAQNKLG